MAFLGIFCIRKSDTFRECDLMHFILRTYLSEHIFFQAKFGLFMYV
jgi:hypothetical protein